MIFALIIGYVAFDEIPTMTTVWGALIIIAAGVLIIWRERQLGLERAKQRRANTP
jgi:drug/metabolite transporter (DMT)-like permease